MSVRHTAKTNSAQECICFEVKYQSNINKSYANYYYVWLR